MHFYRPADVRVRPTAANSLPVQSLSTTMKNLRKIGPRVIFSAEMEVNGRIDQVRRCHRRFLKRAGRCIDLLGRYFVWIWKKDQVKLVDRYLLLLFEWEYLVLVLAIFKYQIVNFDLMLNVKSQLKQILTRAIGYSNEMILKIRNKL